ncbi:MAG TPA: methyltransferase domain-containing protein [Candidatus Limnocylindrales bacterium]|nr:methyltransferase domain-containing protein [Candidatus Limnocylindrales bacterium]
MADLPIDLDAGLSEQLARVLDVEGKIPRALEALGPVAGRDVILIDGPAGIRARQLTDLGARVTLVDSSGPLPFDAADSSADVVVACWSAFRGDAPEQLAEAARVLRPGGRLLVVHDYGRDDVSVLRGPLPEHGPWSRPGGPFLGNGFKVRVIHCWWTYESIDSARSFLADAFGAAGAALGAGLTRPRLSYNVAVYHRTLGEEHP